MKRFREQFNKEAEHLKLPAAEKRELRERLTAYMEYHPLPAKMRGARTQSRQAERITSEPFSLVRVPFGLLFKTSAFAAALVLVIVPFMAEQAVPGDALYGVKVQFNEELRGSLTFGSYDRVEWETERLNRRIAEARVLENEGRLTEAVEAAVAQAVRNHTASAQQEIEALRTEDIDGAAIAQIALDTTLEVQSASLRTSQADTSTSTPADARPNLIASAIDESLSDSIPYTASSTLPSYAKLSARVEQNTTRILELRDSITDLAADKQLQEVNRRIEDVERIIADALDLVSEEERAAQLRLIEALQRSQRLIVYMTEIQVIESIDIDTLVPVVLTEAEQQQVRETLTNEIATKVARIEATLDSVEEEAIVEKAAQNLDEIAVMQADIASTADPIVLQERAKEALQLADDTLLMFEFEPVPADTSSGSTTPETTSSTASSTVESAGENGDARDTSSTTSSTPEEANGVDDVPSSSAATSGQSTAAVDTET